MAENKELSDEELDAVAGGWPVCVPNPEKPESGNKDLVEGGVNVFWGGPVDISGSDAFMGHPKHTDEPVNGRWTG